MDIAAWVRDLGLERYEPAFRENEIDAEVLPQLTEAHLATLGLPLGPRLKLLNAIAALREGAAPSPAVEQPSETPVPAAAPSAAAERRQLTVMFCDLVGSTALAARLDPEELRDVIGAYHRCVSEAVRRFDGFVAKYMGDGVLVYFGYPQAHEDDADRSVRSALALVEACRSRVRLRAARLAPHRLWPTASVLKGAQFPRRARRVASRRSGAPRTGSL